MKNTKTIVFAVSFLAAMLLAAPAFAQQITRTDWQMHEGQDVIILAKKLTERGTAEVFAHAVIPPEKDKGWKPAPNPQIIAFGGPSASKLPKDKCNQAVDYTYFQTFVDVPANAKVTEFKITFEGMDDASRITIFNKANPSGTIVSGSYVKRGERGTTDLHSLITAGPNRIVVTQVDDCAIGNQLAKAEVVLNGHTITPAVKAGPFIPIAHGDVHMRSSDGLTFDFQAAGDYIYFQSTDKDIMVQARQVMWDQNPKVSVIRAGAMRVGKDTIELYALPSLALLVNGKETPMPTARLDLPNGGWIVPSKSGANTTLLIYWPGESFVARMIHYGANNTLDVQIRRDLPQKRTTEGLIGALDGDRANDLKLRDGTKLTNTTNDNIARLGESWQVRSGESLFKRSGAANAVGVVKQQPGVADLDPAARVTARDTCAKAGINDPLALRSCTYDVAATGDKSFVESAKQVQAAVAALPKAERAAETTDAAAIQAPAAASSAGSTLFLLGEKLGRGNRYSMEGHYVTFQQDGNLCVYTNANKFVWCVNNDPKVNYQAAAVVELTKEGQLVMRDAKGAILWAAPAKPAPGARVVLSASGALELRNGANAVVWTSKP